ncbi:BnaC04g24100D, partial [Brassica napus]
MKDLYEKDKLDE